MTWKNFLGSVGLIVVGFVNQAQAGPQVAAATVPASSSPVRTSGPIYSTQIPGSGCATPGSMLPGTIYPGAGIPGTVPPGTGTPNMGTVPPSTTSPGMGGATSPGAAGAAAAAAAAGADSAVGGGGGEGGSSSLANAAPAMIGDLGVRGVGAADVFVSGSVRSVRTSPLVSAGAFKIAENESPRPQNRVFLTYNYFNHVNSFGETRNFDLHREVIGFEKTFLDGNASLGARLPFLQRGGGDGPNTIDGVGDLSVILKYAAINDRRTGNVASGGLVVTVPTGRDLILANGTNLQSVLLQPWAGFIANADRFYLQGFASGIIPTTNQDASLISADLGLGYKLYMNPLSESCLTAIIPTIEGHLLTPLGKQGLGNVLNANALVGLPNQVIMTAGVHLGLWNRAYLTFAAAAPVTGPRLYSYEGIVQFNVGF